MHKKWLFSLILFGLFVNNIPAFAISGKEAELEPARLNLFLQESDYLTGDWLGARTYLEDHGINIQSSLTITPMVFGKNHKAKGAYQNFFSLGAEIDTEKIGLHKGGRFYTEYIAANAGIDPTGYLGSYSEINCLAPEKNMSQLAQFYYEHTFRDDLFNLKIGKQDANEDFHVIESGEVFINHSFHVAPNIPMPDYLTPQMGIRAKLRIAENAYLQTGIYDGDIREGATPKAFFTGEKGYVTFGEIHYLSDFKEHEGKYVLGGWLRTDGHGHEFEENHGGYLAFDQKLIHTLGDHSGGLSLMGQLSLSSQDVSEIPCYCSLGLVWSGIGEKRKEDKIGLALAWLQYSDELKQLENKTNEKIIELFYKLKVTEFLAVKPAMQYIMHRGGDGMGAFALGIRTELMF